MKICVAFFGITRSLSHTKDSILENVLSPLSAFFDVEIVAHFYENAFDETAEGGLLEKEILPFDALIYTSTQIYIFSIIGTMSFSPNIPYTVSKSALQRLSLKENLIFY